MIVSLHKYLFIGPRGEMDRFFHLAQRGGFLEFIGLSHKRGLEMPQEAKTILSAIKIARAHAPLWDEPYVPSLDPVPLSQQMIDWYGEREKLLEEERMLNAEIARVGPFGDFSRDEVDQIESETKRVFQFFCMKSDLARDMALPSELIYVGTEYDLDYFVSINKERAQYPKMIEMMIDRPIGKLRARLHEVRLHAARLEGEISSSSKALSYLQTGLLDALNGYHLQLAKHQAAAPLGSSLFAIEAWVPKTKIKALEGLLTTLDVHAEQIAIESKDKIPTCQENRGIAKIGEDLVQVYDTPSPTDRDPSLWILSFFALFFAIIVSDAGYGLIYFCLGLFLKWKVKNPSSFVKRVTKLVLIVSASSIVWGVLTASFFGIEIGPNHPLRKISFLHSLAVQKADYHLEEKDDVYEEYAKEFPEAAQAENGSDFLIKASKEIDGKLSYQAQEEFYDNILLELSLLIGVIHLSLSFIRYMDRNWTGIGWILFMIGGYLYFPSFLEATSLINFLGWVSKPAAYAAGEKILYAGLALVFVISLLQKKKWGALHELTNAIQVFADVLSYLRLYALALAGMIMASTFNELGVKAGLVGGAFIILIGHMTNLTLTIMSGVIHGLRLNFLEWYHYSFEGGGRLFDPLRIRKVK